MSNQLQITGGAKVRSLEGVITGTSGVLGALGINVPSGIPQLDTNGKILVSQLPNSVMEYKGTWDASTNTPTLANGTGNQGDVYLCSAAGTVNFGAGPITFAVGDQVIYSGTIWQKAGGATGTVTSVAVSRSGDALAITGSPITTAGTINIGFSGNSGQYIDGSGNLTTFPSIITQAQNLVTEVYNETGATLTKGTVVYINGGHGNLPTVTKALATGDATSAQTYGMVRADITNNNNGYVTVIGNLDNMDTQAYAAGTQLYLSSTTAGAYTSVKQYAPAHLVYVGIVVRSHPTQGVIEVRIQNGFELDELHNVSAQTPSNNQGLFYNSSNSLWENKSIATALGYTPADNSLVVHLAGTETITGGKTFTGSASFNSSLGNSPIFSYGAAFVKGNTPSSTSGAWSQIYAASGDNNIVIADNLNTSKLQFQVDASYTYTYPNLSGTLALLEGIQTFTGDKTFNGGVDFNNSLNINNTFNLRNNLVGSTLYTNFSILKSGSLETLSLLFSTANSSKLVFNDAANYTYTYPTITGTIALLEGTQTFNGSKTFSATTSLNTIYVDGLSYIKNQISTTSYITGYTTFSAKANGIIEYYFPTAYKSILDFNDGADYTYTFPASSGTIALTSDIPSLSGYVPYTGATTNVNLGANNLTSQHLIANGLSGVSGTLQLKQNTSYAYSNGYTSFYTTGNNFAVTAVNSAGTSLYNAIFDLSASTSSRTFTLPTASGTIALTSNLSSYVPYTGATSSVDLGTNSINASVVNAMGAGSSAGQIFMKHGSGFSLSAGFASIGSDASYNLYFYNTVSAATKGFILNAGNITTGSAKTYTLPDANGTLVLGTGTTNYLPKFTGASTIGDSIVYASSTGIGIGTTTPNEQLELMAANAYTSKIRFSYGTGASGYYTNFGYNSNGNKVYLNIVDGSVSKTAMVWDYTGNVGIGTSSPYVKLDVLAANGATDVAYFKTSDFVPASTGSRFGIGFSSATGNAATILTSTSQGQNAWDDMQFKSLNHLFFTNNTERMRITSGGAVLIGLTSPPANVTSLYIGGSGSSYFGVWKDYSGSSVGYEMTNNAGTLKVQIFGSSGNYYFAGSNISDARSKSNINQISNGLDYLLKLKPSTFTYDKNPDIIKGGFIAQEVLEVIPEFVTIPEDKEEMMGVDYFGILALAVKAIQEQQEIINNLSAKVTALENK